MSGASFLQVTTTVGSRDAAERLAAELVEARLVACAQVSGPIASTYRWQGGVERAEEWYCHLKTAPDRFDAVADAIRARHPYETPEIVGTLVTGTDDYAAWVRESVSDTD